MTHRIASICCAAALAVTTFGLEAGLRQYVAPVQQSQWMLTDNNRLQCTLKHPIPGYGDAMFTSMASKQLNLEFELDMLRLPDSFSVANVYSAPPSWMPGARRKDIGQMQLRKQYNGDLPETVAWTMLSELEKGFRPTVFYQDWYNQYDKIAVGLNAANFRATYHAFSQCVSNLLPYDFDDIAYTVLGYKKNSVELTKYSQKRLTMIGDYLKEDTELELVLLAGYSDSYGGRWNNLQLSEKRANEVKQYFADMGVDMDRISVTGYGEKRHIAPNSTPEGRALNRRVVIHMAKP